MEFMKSIGVSLVAWGMWMTMANAAEWKLHVRAGESERHNCPVEFALPEAIGEGPLELQTGDNHSLPVQRLTEGRGLVILPHLAKNQEVSFAVVKAGPTAAMKLSQTATQLAVATTDGKPIMTYQTHAGPVPQGVDEVFAHGAYLHPLYSPSGRLVTADHPEDHRWHRGVWMAWTKTEFEGGHPDFWNMGKEKSGLTGEVRFEALASSFVGPISVGFESHHRFIDHTGGSPKDVLKETWHVATMQVGKGREAVNLIDLTSSQTCAGSSHFKLPKYHYGGLGVRGNLTWNPVDQVSMLTSEGKDRKSGDGTKAKWVYLGGKVDGETAGIAILIHPANFRFPQPLRLNPKNPQLCIAPSADGDWEIQPGQPLVSRYRLVIMDGAPEPQQLERLWQDYAQPPEATVRQ